MENRAQQNFNPTTGHDDAVAVHGLDDLFQWASDTMAEGLDGRARRVREQQVKRQVLNIIHRSADLQAKAKHADELAYLQRRVIALQGVMVENAEQITALKGIAVTQYYGLQRIPQLEEKIVQLEQQCQRIEQVEEDRKHLTTVVANLQKQTELLDDIVAVNESENTRLAALLAEAKQEITTLKNRRWWQLIFKS